MTTKRCSRCKQTKPADEFGRRAGTPWLKSDCRSCEREARKSRYHAHPDRERRYFRRSMLKRVYGMSESDYEALVVWHGGRCAICFTTDPGTPHFHIDHDHSGGDVRGLLCNRCNLGLGYFADDPQLLMRAAEYLLYHVGHRRRADKRKEMTRRR